MDTTLISASQRLRQSQFMGACQTNLTSDFKGRLPLEYDLVYRSFLNLTREVYRPISKTPVRAVFTAMIARSAPAPWATYCFRAAAHERTCSATRGASPARSSSLDGGEPSSAIRARVAVQAERFAPLNKPHMLVNGDMGPAVAAFEQRRIRQHAALLPGRRRGQEPHARRPCTRWT